MSELCNRIVHFGNNITQLIINHEINSQTWQNFYDRVSQLSLWTNTMIQMQIKVYYHEGLIYEYDIQSGKCICYADEYGGLGMLKMNTESDLNSALTYILKRKKCDQCDLLPINNYYNIHEIERSQFDNESFSVIFEKKGQSHEIKLVCNNIDLIAMENILKQLMFCRSIELTQIIAI